MQIKSKLRYSRKIAKNRAQYTDHAEMWLPRRVILVLLPPSTESLRTPRICYERSVREEIGLYLYPCHEYWWLMIDFVPLTVRVYLLLVPGTMDYGLSG
jgi:hypothetical protein